jgi:hypothetical protein
MNNQGTLFGLNRIVPAHLNQRPYHMIESIHFIIEQDKRIDFVPAPQPVAPA